MRNFDLFLFKKKKKNYCVFLKRGWKEPRAEGSRNCAEKKAVKCNKV